MTWHNPQTAQVRWIDALNTGDVEIPGHAVVWVNSGALASYYGAEVAGDPYVLEIVQFAEIDATFLYSMQVAGPYGPACEAQERYHDVMCQFAVNSPVPIPAGSIGRVTLDPPFVALSDSTDDYLVPKAGTWNLTNVKNEPLCSDPFPLLEWFRVLRDLRPTEEGIRPMFVDLTSGHGGAA